MQLFEENKPKASSFSPDLQLRMYATDDKISAKFLVTLPEMMNPLKQVDIPIGLREGLKDTD